MAGIIGAEGDNRIGVAGVAWQAELMNLVYDPYQIDRKIPEAVRYAVDNGAKVINISLGDNIKISPDGYTKKGFNKAVRKAYLRAEDHFLAANNDVLVISAGMRLRASKAIFIIGMVWEIMIGSLQAGLALVVNLRILYL